MKIQEFCSKHDVKEKTVKKWLQEELIPGAVYIAGEWVIPNSARVPYVEARARKPSAINFSILRACYKRQHVLPKLYHLSEKEFACYIKGLLKADVIQSYEEDGVIYYSATIKGESVLQGSKKGLDKLLESMEIVKNIGTIVVDVAEKLVG